MLLGGQLPQAAAGSRECQVLVLAELSRQEGVLPPRVCSSLDAGFLLRLLVPGEDAALSLELSRQLGMGRSPFLSSAWPLKAPGHHHTWFYTGVFPEELECVRMGTQEWKG